ncbi:MAG: tRNA (N(6)-L-threonylcarbamoyladenosine(37)-C(2))-methylthiotransferase MtaB [Lachnospiraceae bacterium]
MNNFTSKTAAIHNLGCKVNSYESDAMQQLLEENGFQIVDFSEIADVYVINTCSVTNMADRKSRQMIHKAKRKNADAVIVAAGCYVQTKTQEAQLDEAIDIIIGNNKKHELIEKLEDFFMIEKKEQLIALSEEQPYFEEMKLSHSGEHTRAFIKVQDGCNQFCSYCIIPYARGRVRSRKISDIISEVQRLAGSGCREVVLTGIHLSSYGIDLSKQPSLLSLIKAVADIRDIARIRLGSLEPRIISEEFLRELSFIDKFCPHFHISLQSGCDATLKRMNRHYTIKEYIRSCDLIRSFFEHPAITTDVIVGFPKESEEEFEETKQMLMAVGFYEMHIFKYSKREGTKAALMQGQIPEPTKTRRSSQLLELEKKMSKEFRDFWIGKETEILLEAYVEINGIEYLTGYTKEYIKVVTENKGQAFNTFVSGRIERQLQDEKYLLVEF